MAPVRPTPGTAYAAAQSAGRDALRRMLLDTASGLLEQEGPDALTMRRIAAEAGCSTTVLYTMFDNKAGIAEGLWREGFRRLRDALLAARGDTPLERLAAVGRAYRDSALANRAYYAVMFQRPIPGFHPSPEAQQESAQALQVLVDAVTACVDAGELGGAAPDHIAAVLWAAAHGAVSLEVAGYEAAVDPQARFDDALAAAAAWFMPDRPVRATRRAARPKPPS
jgi:AcrR family transcriptional regulator